MAEIFAAIINSVPAFCIVGFMWFSNYGPGGQR